MYENGLFIFHRDLRCEDNVGLMNAALQCKHVYCCFIFTPEQVGEQNKYKSNNAVQFMIESLEELKKSISNLGGELVIFYGNTTSLVLECIQKISINAVFFNKDYSPFALSRTASIDKICKEKNIDCNTFADYYLYEPGTVVASGGKAYKKYTPFYDDVVNNTAEKPKYIRNYHFAKYAGSPLSHKITLDYARQHFTNENPDILVHGGRTNAIKCLKKAAMNQRDYANKRDQLTYKTTSLSAYIKFGCVSIREVYHAISSKYGKESGIIRELIWREFFVHVLFAYPSVVGQSYQEKYQKIKWRTSTSDFNKWKMGMTGFPIVDAGMRQLNQTGYMHNRVRMMAASFLIKVLLIDWRLGEKYFAQKLTDYDLASNNGNWQGISGTGVDMKPYFRDMNPWIQSIKFDNNAEYIKSWIPELAEVAPKDIHHWDIANDLPQYKSVKYPAPIVNYTLQKEKMIDLYRKYS